MSNPQPDVLSQVSEFIRRYLQCSEHQRTILALWVLHTYCFPAAQVTPYLSIRSAHKQSGKTLCLQLLALLCEGSALTSGGFKASDLAWPMQAKPISALLLDECHHTIGTRSRSKGPALRALFAASFHLLHGHSNIAQEHNAFCPKAFAGRGPLPEELADRSIPIILEPLKVSGPLSGSETERVAQAPSPVSRLQSGPQPPSAALPKATSAVSSDDQMTLACPRGELAQPKECTDDLVERFHLRHAIAQVQPIRKRLNHWADVHLLPLLDKMSPLPRSAFPPNLTPRQQDIVEPLLQIAGLIGGPWPRRALQAFAIIFDLQTHFDLLPNLQLLADARNCFAHHGDPQRLSTTDLLDWLHSLPARPWATEYDADGPLTAYKVARLLWPFAIRPRNQRVGKDDPARGYQLEDFKQAWKHYFALDPAGESPKLAARSQQLEAQTSEIVNKDKGCNTVSPADASSDDPMTRCTDDPIMKSWIACSPECELEAGGTGKLENQNDDLANLSTQQIRERKETLMRELSPLFSQSVPGSGQTQAQKPEITNPESKIINKNAVCNTVAAVHTTAVRRSPDVVKDPGRRSLSPAAGPACPGLPWGVPTGRRVAAAPEARRGETNLSPLERLTGLHNSLRLDGAVDLPAMAQRYKPQDLKARLDWAETNAEWNRKLIGKRAPEFFWAFDEIGLLMKR